MVGSLRVQVFGVVGFGESFGFNGDDEDVARHEFLFFFP